MIALLSPAMNMGNVENSNIKPTTPVFIKEANYLATILKKYDPWELEQRLSITPSLMEKTYSYYERFDTTNNVKGSCALVSFQGLAYKNLNPNDFTKENFNFASKHLRILSALYGILKPSDIIQPYRLDFISRFAKEGINGQKLYEYWGDKIYKELFKSNDTVVNICSAEYEKLIKPFLQPHNNFVTIKFLVNKGGKVKSYATAAKMARGEMARYIVQNEIENVEDLKDFDCSGYKYSEFYSNDNIIAFVK